MTLAMGGSCFAVSVCSRIRDDAGNGRCRCHRWAAEIDLGFGVAHAAFEIAVGGAEGGFIIPQRVLERELP